jgi:prolyl-tRNA synthetase
MAHSDDSGLVLPPKMATNQVVIVPIWKSDDEKSRVLNFAGKIYQELREDIRIILDDREQYKPGYKFAEWELLGIPVRIEIGPRDEDKKQAVVVRRDTREKIFISADELRNKINSLLVTMQKDLLDKSRSFREENTYNIDSYDDFKQQIENPGGFFNAHWCGSAECEQKIKGETKATIRLIPIEQPDESGKCILCSAESQGRVIFARAY